MSIERPILFNGAMVRALLSGAKTQTRRVMKPQPEPTPSDYPTPGHRWPSKAHQTMLHVEAEMQKLTGLAGHACPFGQPGDRLWVRETTEADHDTSDAVTLSRYSADGAPVCYAAGTGDGFDGAIQHWRYGRNSRPSIHMPRDACRLVLGITDVRVERLHAISEADALAEGVDAASVEGYRFCPVADVMSRAAGFAFRDLWTSTGGDWDSNPWVWVIEFKRVEETA